MLLVPTAVLYHCRLLLAWLFAAPCSFDKKASSQAAKPASRSTPADGYEVYIEQLFRTHYVALCRTVYPIVRGQDTAEDIVQDVFMKTYALYGREEIGTRQ